MTHQVSQIDPAFFSVCLLTINTEKCIPLHLTSNEYFIELVKIYKTLYINVCFNKTDGL